MSLQCLASDLEGILITVLFFLVVNARRQWGGSSYTSGENAPTSTKKDLRGGIHVTTTTGVQESYELSARDRPFDGSAPMPIGGAGGTIGDVKRKPMDDGLSLQSDSIGSDEGVDAFDSSGRQKLADEETTVAPHHFPAPPSLPDPQDGNGRAPPSQRHPFVNVVTPNGATSPQRVARGGRTEVNVEWSTAL